jgi:hypothetical protein
MQFSFQPNWPEQSDRVVLLSNLDGKLQQEVCSPLSSLTNQAIDLHQLGEAARKFVCSGATQCLS